MDTQTPSGDSSWTGWAISSFTNKMATASGEMSSRPAPVSLSGPRPKDVLKPTDTPSLGLGKQATSTVIIDTNPRAALARNLTDTTKLAASFTAPDIAEDEWGSGEWAGVDETDGADEAWNSFNNEVNYKNSSTTSLNSPATPSLQVDSPTDPDLRASIESTKIASTNKLKTSSEPDFASWLKAQQGSKSSKPLPKGIGVAKSGGNVPSKSHRPVTSRSSTGTSTSVKRIVQPPKPSAEQEKNEDDWGEAW